MHRVTACAFINRKPMFPGPNLHAYHPKQGPVTPSFRKAYTQNPHDPSYATADTLQARPNSRRLLWLKKADNSGDWGGHPLLWVTLPCPPSWWGTLPVKPAVAVHRPLFPSTAVLTAEVIHNQRTKVPCHPHSLPLLSQGAQCTGSTPLL